MISTKTLLGRLAAGVVLSAAAFAAQADTYQFTLTGAYNASWTLDSTLDSTVDGYKDGQYFYVKMSGLPDYGNDLTYLRFFNEHQTYYTNPNSISLLTEPGAYFQFYDFSQSYYALDTYQLTEQLYTGPESTPTFKLGTFQLINMTHDHAAATLVISNISAVPEPASIAVLLAGLGAVSCAVARRRKAG
jgi:hypothetical protein